MNIINQFKHYVDNDNLSDLFISDLDTEYYCEQYIRSTGFTPLMKLVLMGHLYKNNIDKLLQIIKKHIEENPIELNKKNAKGYTALMLVCANSNRCDSEKIIELLLKHNCDINSQDCNGHTALMHSCYNFNSNIIKMLLKYDKQDCDINLQDNYGQSALILSCNISNSNIVKILLKYDKQNCDINLQNNFGQTTLMEACNNSNLNIVKMLLKYDKQDCDINLQDHYGNTTLMFACHHSNSNIVKMLLKYDKQDCDINAQNYDRKTALTIACYSSNSNIVKMLLKYDKQDCDINLQDHYGHCALKFACRYSHFDNIKMLLEYDKQYCDKTLDSFECVVIKRFLSNDKNLNRNIIKNINYYNLTFLDINENVAYLLDLGLNSSLINYNNEQLKEYTRKINNINYLLDKYYSSCKLYNVFKYYDAFIELLKINTIKKFVNQELLTIIIFHLFS